MAGFKSFDNAATTITGIELVHRVCRNQVSFGRGRRGCSRIAEWAMALACIQEVRNSKLRASDLGMHQNRYSQHEEYVTPGLGCRWMTHGRPGLLGARVRTDVDAVPVVIATAARLHAEGWSPRGERTKRAE